MDLVVQDPATTELAAAFLEVAVTLGLALIFLHLFRLYHKRSYAAWGVAWSLYALRLGAIITFLVTADRVWLYWHQVVTGWTALAILWAALVFSQRLEWKRRYLVVAVFPVLWSYAAIYQLDNFLLAAGPAVAFLSAATLWAGWALFRYHRQVRSRAALMLAVGFFLWALHHLDYPFLRAQGTWAPWGYYLDLIFQLWMGAGMLLLVIEDQYRGLATLSALSGQLQGAGGDGQRDRYMLDDLLKRPLTLPAVRGSALFLLDDGEGRFAGGAGTCADWTGVQPMPGAARAIRRAIASGVPEILRQQPGMRAGYVAALPIIRETTVIGALVIVGDAVDPFAALDTKFLTALGRQVGAALENADLYRRVEERTRRLEELAKRMVQHHEDERRRLSRELHDETAQVFSAVKLQLGMLRERVDPALERRVDHALELVDAGIESIRSVTHDLRPSLLDDLGLLPALRALVDEFGERTGIVTTLVAPNALPVMSGDAELALFRALQEALANVARHAQATAVTVTMAAGDGVVEMRVEDNGRGTTSANLEQHGRMGLVGMRERLTALGGTLAIDVAAPGGVRLDVRVPATVTPA
jgi:signal transduction histidine kinase